MNAPYEFSVSAIAEDEFEWLWCTVEFTVPDDIRPPFFYLRGNTEVPITSFTRRDATDEGTTLEIREQIDEFDLQFRAEPADSSTDLEEIPIELNFDGVLVDSSIRDTEYYSASSISLVLQREFA